MRRPSLKLIIPLSAILLLLFLYRPLLALIGKGLVVDETPLPGDAVVVLNTGLEYYPRLIEASNLYRRGLAEKIVINGDRKTDMIRAIEQKGFSPCCSWEEDRLRVLELFGVPREAVFSLSLEDPYDTVTEAAALAEALLAMNMKRLLIVTSKTHTRRARFIWKSGHANTFSITVVSAGEDPFDPEAWYREGRQVKWVLSEYGAWLYALWKRSTWFNRGKIRVPVETAEKRIGGGEQHPDS